MDSEKVGSSSESSSEEQSDRSCDQVKEDDSDSKRCYECIFCRRGFTNAQALGGHMNIHRKDRANKAKKITSSSSSSSDLQSNKQIHQSTFTNTPYLWPLLVVSQVNYQASPSNPHGYFQELADSNIMNLWGSDLSLQIGPSTRPLWNGDGVDLELRLGHHP